MGQTVKKFITGERFSHSRFRTYIHSLKKETKLLAAMLCALLVLYALTFLHRPSHSTVFSSSLMRETDIPEIFEIRFSIPTRSEPVEMGEMTLTKEGTRFYLRTARGSYPVRTDIMERFFALLSTERSFRPMAVHLKYYPDIELDEAHASHLVFTRKDKTILSELFFGTANTAGTARYVRLGARIAVFLIDTGLDSFLTVAAPFWLDLQLYAALMHGTSIQGVEYGTHSIARSESNDKAFISLEGFLKKCSCIDIYSAPQLQNPQTIQVRLMLGDGTAVQFSASPLQSGDYVFFDSRTARTYLMSSYTFKQLMRHVKAITDAVEDARLP